METQTCIHGKNCQFCVKVQSYKITYVHKHGWWVSTVDGMVGVHSQGKTLPEARTRTLEALAAASVDLQSTIITEVVL